MQDETVETFDLAAGVRSGLQVYNGHRGRVGVLRRRLLARRHQGLGVRRRPGRRARLCRGATARSRPAHDPGRQLPGRARLRTHPARRPPVRRRQPRRGAVLDRLVRGSAGPRGAGDRPGHEQGHARRSTSACRSTRSTSRSTGRHEGLRHQLDGPLGGRDRHRHPEGDRRRSRCRRRATRSRPTTRPAIVANPRSSELYVANANSDTVSVDRRAQRPAGRDDRRRRRCPARPRARCRRASPSARTAPRCTWPRRARTRSPSSTCHPHGARPHPDRLVSGRRQGDARRPPAGGRQHQRLRRRPQPLRPVLAAARARLRNAASSTCRATSRTSTSGTHDPRLGAGDRPAAIGRDVPVPARRLDGPGAAQQPRRPAAGGEAGVRSTRSST